METLTMADISSSSHGKDVTNQVSFVQSRKVSLSTRGHGGAEGGDEEVLEGIDNIGFTDIVSMEDSSPPPYMDYDHGDYQHRKMSRMETQAKFEELRKRHLSRIRESLSKDLSGKDISQYQLETLLQQKEFCSDLFQLFDHEMKGYLVQEDWISSLRKCSVNLRSGNLMQELVDILDSVTYLLCKDDDITSERFYEIWTSRGVLPKLLSCIDKDQDAIYTLEEFMAFIISITSKIQDGALTRENIEWLETVFRDNVGEGQTEFTLNQFKKIVPSKNTFFVEGAFRIFDKDSSGSVSLEEFLETMHQFSLQGDEEKLSFLFKVYDPNGDGVIDQSELRDIIRSCVAENGMEFDETQVDELAGALFEDAVKPGKEGISVDDLSDQFKKHKGLLENLTLSIGKWLVPPKPVAKKKILQRVTEKIPKFCSRNYFLNNLPFILFLSLILMVNLVLFIQRAVYFRDFTTITGLTPNPFYLLSRACGRTLLFNSVLILVLVLRYTITMLRDLGLASVLPLDNNIYFHKLVGRLLFVQAWIHAVMHFINFGLNVAPDPVKFLQLTGPYWTDWTRMGYNPPPGCQLVTRDNSLARHCSLEAFTIPPGLSLPVNITHCQACSNGTSWTYSDWMLTTSPGLFGLVGGLANPTGIALIIILTLMVICSMSFVRRSGYFQIFYFSHLNYWLYWGLLVLHAPTFWQWLVFFAIIFIAEKLYRMVSWLMGRGVTVIEEGTSLPSRVTALKIRKPAKFNYSPGDWCFIKIPTIAIHEWHPFTISSAPEDPNYFSVHIRGVGHWTNKVYQHFKSGQSRPGDLEMNGKEVEIMVDGPFGSPSSNIYRAEHAVLIGTGIGITPFASILQSIAFRYKQVKKSCPKCHHSWADDLSSVMNCLKKVDFFWINRDQRSFEWFVSLLSQLELEMADVGGVLGRFLEMHMYITSALQKTDMKSVFLQLAMDLNFKKDQRDFVTGLKSRTNAGRPNWNKVFTKIKEQRKGKVTVFFCGNPLLGRALKEKCNEFGFTFRKEVF